MNLEKEYQEYLIGKGCKVKTPKGGKSTVPVYVDAINRVVEERHITWSILAEEIDTYVIEYEVGGSHEEEGKRSHRSTINALKRFQEMLHTRCQHA